MTIYQLSTGYSRNFDLAGARIIAALNPSVCKEKGELLDNSLCVELGECSWFNHSQDSYRFATLKDNYPPGFDGSTL